ncbi:DUF3109 family protein [Wenyingzhuangia sp. 2_MG-2023]|uniref:DUF3109 family protein n=1 Tax=Wenyingzhuangia sp. 2_MG-2023 TaxID=3062639 RepID=UPI0026E25C4E|nr:DUF3109 family protein [Wenyingzhuangia sp. 2_MG-2023]MDO6736981.1 DUF3109 family protein [Wenyingzhuangia sp. 2_MG-2023]
MFQIGKTIVSEEVIENDFVCNISACKGECCVAGDAGAPVLDEEIEKLNSVYPKIKHLLRPEGVKAIEEQGTYTTSPFGEHETTLVNDKECAFVTSDEKGITSCGIEQAYNKGLVDWKKPISCHLYPIRVQDYTEFAAVNYNKWDICDDACTLGKELQVPVYKFLKNALILKFGENWYMELEKVAEEWKKQKKTD